MTTTGDPLPMTGSAVILVFPPVIERILDGLEFEIAALANARFGRHELPCDVSPCFDESGFSAGAGG